MEIPIIDFSAYDESNPDSLVAIGREVSLALTNIGFMAVTNIGINAALLRDVFSQSKQFFELPIPDKQALSYSSAKDNFGYQGVLEESLDPALPADIKETFTMRTPNNYANKDRRWPSSDFKRTNIEFYEHAVSCANKVLRVFAAALNVELNFFTKTVNNENVTLRLLHYPSVGSEVNENQLGAGAHTDYGVITLLFQDAVGGLEVQDSQGQWQGVDYVKDAIVVNTGDLMERWTNGKYKSTLHRVQPKIGQQERYSVAVFIDPDSDTRVEVLQSCTSESNPAKYGAITAGEHIQSKLLATHQ